MTRIRNIEIDNFRSIKRLSWQPSPGMNCLIGPGDSGKSTILDAIDLCLGARRNIPFDDSDFYGLNVTAPISISLTIGELDDALKNMDTYGLFLRGFKIESGEIVDEPEAGAETVLTLNLTVASDLEPAWTLVSDRAKTQNATRNLAWADRVRIAPARIGMISEHHLGWRRGSVLNRLSDDSPDASGVLLEAGRAARSAFGDEASKELNDTLTLVATTATALGVPINGAAKAMLDAESVSLNGGTISLHDGIGVPLRGLGIGSARLLIAGLQREAAQKSTLVLVDELEYGLEPHRIIRLLASLGAKDAEPLLQAFVTTHSPAALRELSGNQLFVTRARGDIHELRNVGTDHNIQSTIRLFPEAFLAPSVIVCEGASEVGLVRGLDRRRIENNRTGIGALGVALVDSGGIGNVFTRAFAFQELGYRVALIRDDDDRPDEAIESKFTNNGGTVIAWRDGRALEDELFMSLSNEGIVGLIDRAIEIHGENTINAHIASRSTPNRTASTIRDEAKSTGVSSESRQILANSAKIKRSGWFKSVTWMEDAAYDVVSQDLRTADAGFVAILDGLFKWCSSAGQ